MKSYLVIGMGKFAQYLVKNLSKLGNDIMIVDKNEENISELLEYVVSAKIADCTNKEVLNSFGIEDFTACIVCIGKDFQSSLEITDHLKELGAKHIISMAYTDMQAKFLLKTGADQMIFPERDIAERVAVALSNDNIFEYIELSKNHSILEVISPKKWIGKSIIELGIRSKYYISILAIKNNNEEIYMPASDYVFNEDDHLIILGGNDDIVKVFGANSVL